jgi:hypothetical protein
MRERLTPEELVARVLSLCRRMTDTCSLFEQRIALFGGTDHLKRAVANSRAAARRVAQQTAYHYGIVDVRVPAAAGACWLGTAYAPLSPLGETPTPKFKDSPNARRAPSRHNTPDLGSD